MEYHSIYYIRYLGRVHLACNPRDASPELFGTQTVGHKAHASWSPGSQAECYGSRLRNRLTDLTTESLVSINKPNCRPLQRRHPSAACPPANKVFLFRAYQIRYDKHAYRLVMSVITNTSNTYASHAWLSHWGFQLCKPNGSISLLVA